MSIRVGKVPGSKWRIAATIAGSLPQRRVYLEPFFGSGAVLFNRRRSTIEIVNDLDDRVVALFKVLREQPRELARVVALTPFARTEWLSARSGVTPVDDLEKARRFLVLNWQAHGGRAHRSGFRHPGSSPRAPAVAREWADLPRRISAASARLQGVLIENCPALELLRRYCGPEVSVFLDPPYPGETVHGRRRALYRFEMRDEEGHGELLDAACGHSGPVVLSSYRNDLYDDRLLGRGWTVHELAARGEHGVERSEALYMNAAASPARSGQLSLEVSP